MMDMPQAVLDWLLEEENPSIRYRALRELLDQAEDDRQVQQARERIPSSKIVQKIFNCMHPDGYWLHCGLGAGIEYSSPSTTHFILAHLAELGLDRQDPRIARAVERYLSLSQPDRPDPALWQTPPDYRNHQSCLYAFNLRTFILLGYRDDPRIRERIEMLLTDTRPDGGYLCERPSFKATTKSCIRGSLKALSAYALLPKLWDTSRCQELVDYFLRRQVIYRSGRPGEIIRGELTSLLFPFDYRGNLLEPLVALSKMGCGKHPALKDAWEALEGKRDPQGRFPLDWKPTTHFDPGPKGQPNKWTTFYAYLALQYRA